MRDPDGCSIQSALDAALTSFANDMPGWQIFCAAAWGVSGSCNKTTCADKLGRESTSYWCSSVRVWHEHDYLGMYQVGV